MKQKRPGFEADHSPPSNSSSQWVEIHFRSLRYLRGIQRDDFGFGGAHMRLECFSSKVRLFDSTLYIVSVFHVSAESLSNLCLCVFVIWHMHCLQKAYLFSNWLPCYVLRGNVIGFAICGRSVRFIARSCPSVWNKATRDIST